jgi:hypothetical protein
MIREALLLVLSGLVATRARVATGRVIDGARFNLS